MKSSVSIQEIMPALPSVRELFLQISAAGEGDVLRIQGPAVLAKHSQSKSPQGLSAFFIVKLPFISSLLFLKARVLHLQAITCLRRPLRAGTQSSSSPYLNFQQQDGSCILFQTEVFSYPLLPRSHQKGRAK